MIDSEHYRKLERLYLSAPCNEYYTPEIRISEGAAEIVIRVSRKMYHAAGAVHGSVYFKALDDAAFFAVNSLVSDAYVLTASFDLRFVKPISEGKIKAQGKVIKTSSRLFVAESILMNDGDEVIARGSGSFMKSRIALSPEVGYR